MTKANEARSIQCTYEQLLARLKHEQVGFDAALRQLDETAAARAIEVDQLALAARAAQHAGEKARQDAARDEQQLGRERAQRTATLEAQHKDLAALLQPLTLAAAGAAATATSAPDDHGDSKLLSADDAGAAVAQLMAVAGASGRGQLLSRLLQRLEVHRELQHRAEGADTRHADLTKQLQQVTGRLAALREDPVEEAGGGQTPRAVTSAREDRQHRQQQHLPEPSGTGERDTRSRHQQLRNEIHQLVTCVAPLPLSQPPVPLSDETLVDALAQCEQRLRAGLLVLQTDHPEAYAKLMRADDVDSAGAFQTPSAVGEQ